MSSLVNDVRIKLGRLILLWNKNKRGNEKIGYISVWVEDSDGTNERCLLFTEKEILRAENRANKNKEDLPKRNFITMLLD